MSFPAALAVAALTGFIALSYEIVWFRAISFASGSSPAAFGLLLGYYLLGLALGAYASRRLCDDRDAFHRPRARPALGALVLLANAAAFLVLPALAWAATRVTWVAALPLVAIASALLGAVFPLVSHLGVRPDAAVGVRVSWLYMANIVGSAAGSLTTGFVLFDWWSLRTVAIVLGAAGLGLGAVLLARSTPGQPRLAATLGVAAGAAGLTFVTAPTFARIYERLLFKTEFTPASRLGDVVENRNGIIAVTQDSVVYGGGAYDGVVSTTFLPDRNRIFRAYAVAGFHPRPRHILMVGLSTGAWAQVLTHMPGVDSVTIIELNPGYLELIARYPQVSSLLHNPKVRIVVDDGRRWLARNSGRRFDLIVSNTTWHWRAHITNLLSREFMELVRAHLAPGGVLYYNTTGSEEALKTGFAVFPYGFRVANIAAVSDSPIEFDGARLRSALETYRIDGRLMLDLSSAEHRRRLDLLAGLADRSAPPPSSEFESRADVIRRLADTEVVTDDNMLTEWKRLVLVP